MMQVTAVTHRSNPIFPAMIYGKPPMEDYWFGKATERIFLPLVRLFVPELVDHLFQLFHVPNQDPVLLSFQEAAAGKIAEHPRHGFPRRAHPACHVGMQRDRFDHRHAVIGRRATGEPENFGEYPVIRTKRAEVHDSLGGVADNPGH